MFFKEIPPADSHLKPNSSKPPTEQLAYIPKPMGDGSVILRFAFNYRLPLYYQHKCKIFLEFDEAYYYRDKISINLQTKEILPLKKPVGGNILFLKNKNKRLICILHSTIDYVRFLQQQYSQYVEVKHESVSWTTFYPDNIKTPSTILFSTQLNENHINLLSFQKYYKCFLLVLGVNFSTYELLLGAIRNNNQPTYVGRASYTTHKHIQSLVDIPCVNTQYLNYKTQSAHPEDKFFNIADNTSFMVKVTVNDFNIESAEFENIYIHTGLHHLNVHFIYTLE